MENFIRQNSEIDEFVIFGNKHDTFFSEVGDILRKFNKTLVIIIPSIRKYPPDIHEASLKDNVLVYEVSTLGMKSTLNKRTQMYVKNVSNSIIIPRKLYDSARLRD